MTAILIFYPDGLSVFAPENLGWIKLALTIKDFPAATAIFKDFQGISRCVRTLESMEWFCHPRQSRVIGIIDFTIFAKITTRRFQCVFIVVVDPFLRLHYLCSQCCGFNYSAFHTAHWGGSMAEPLERWTCNSEAPSSSPALTASWICSSHGSPEFKSSTTLVDCKLVCLRPVGILNPVKFNLNFLF